MQQQPTNGTASGTVYVQTTLDPSLILARTQYPAIVGKAGKRKPVV
jgi:hypothetical protein